MQKKGVSVIAFRLKGMDLLFLSEKLINYFYLLSF